MANTDRTIYLSRFVAIAILLSLIPASHAQAQVDQASVGCGSAINARWLSAG